MLLLVYKNGLPIGCGAVEIYNEDTMEIKRMFVKPSNRGRCATTILTELEWSLELGFKYYLKLERTNQKPLNYIRKATILLYQILVKYMSSENSICFKKAMDQSKL